MGLTLSLLSLPFEAFEAALILQMPPEKVTLALASGRLKSSHEFRELLPSRSKFVTGWDILEYLIGQRIREIGSEPAARLASCIVDEIATTCDDGCAVHHQLTQVEIAEIASFVLAEEGFVLPVFSDPSAAMGISLSEAVAESWDRLKEGLANLQASMRSVAEKSPLRPAGSQLPSVFALLRTNSVRPIRTAA